MLRKAIRYFAVGMVLFVLCTEAAFWIAGSDSITGTPANCVVLVPGYPTRSDGTAHPIQRFRVEAGVAAYRNFHCGKIILSGGAVSNQYVEAETMASIAKDLGISSDDLIVERQARSTWENVGCSKPFIKDNARLLIVSDPLHAHRAKRYACRQDSSLCSSVSAIGVNPPLTATWWAVPVGANEIRVKIKDLLTEELGRTENSPVCSVGK